jgi:cyclohexanone monooxygenase
MGCKRILISDDYYPALAQPNVDVITDGIREVTASSIVTKDGVERPVDTIVMATGFHVTDSPSYRLVHGIGGRDLLDAFEEHGAYLGTTAHGFPNLFVLSGPNTGIGHTSLVYMIESQIAYVLDAMDTMTRRDIGAVDVRHEVHSAFFEEMQRATTGTVWASGCNSWYLDRYGRNATLWPGFTFQFRRRTRRFDLANYETLPTLSPTRTAPAVTTRALMPLR